MRCGRRVIFPRTWVSPTWSVRGASQKAIQRDLGIPVGVSANLGQGEAEVTGGELKTAVSLGEPPTAQQGGLVARWFIWSILALQWVGESIEANPKP